MIKNFRRVNLYFLTTIAIITLMVCQSFGPVHQAANIIVLQNEASPLDAPTFYIAGLHDARTNTSAIAWLAADGPSAPATQEDLQGGAVVALRTFIQRNVAPGNRQRPIIISIKQLKITETTQPNQRIDGKITVQFSFGIRRSDDTVHLIDYQGGMHYNRPLGNRQVVEPTLRHSLMNALSYFNNWMEKQADTNPQLATGVKLSFSDYTNPADKDTIYYQGNRPLTWEDFQEKNPHSYYTADVFPGFGFDEHVKIVKGIIYLHVAMKVYLPKSDCRVKDGNRSEEVLNHEQRHFDIVKIISERYKLRMLATYLPPENCDGALQAGYFEYMHEMNVMQDSYDGETRHGQDFAAQGRWDRKITDELKRYGVSRGE